MIELWFIIWAVLVLILSFLFRFALKKKKRKIGKYVVFHMLILVLVSFLVSLAMYYFTYPSRNLTWFNHVFFISLGLLNTWIMYKKPWAEFNRKEYEEDSFLIEFMFTFISALFAAIVYNLAPQVLYVVDYKVDLSSTLFAVPILFILPFLIKKLIDISNHIPFRTVENPWLFPIEVERPEEWKWQDLMQVNFQLKKSINDEYSLFSWNSYPWIEAPKDVAIGKIFRLTMQERRKDASLSSIQDMGDEYTGETLFCWLFIVKKIWYNPKTWFRSPRYLDPDRSLTDNGIQKGDVIIARRIPGDGKKSSISDYSVVDEDPEKTIIIY